MNLCRLSSRPLTAVGAPAGAVSLSARQGAVLDAFALWDLHSTA